MAYLDVILVVQGAMVFVLTTKICYEILLTELSNKFMSFAQLQELHESSERQMYSNLN